MVNNSKKNSSIFPASITKMFSFSKKKKFHKKHHIKIRLAKVFTFIIIFVLIFDKATILLVIYLYGLYSYWQPKNKENYTNNNNALVSTIFEPSNNTIASLSRVFKHPELNLKSYSNVKIDPTKVLFEDNKFLPECCFYNSEYSTSKGCPCITGDQQNYLNARGTNKSHISFLQTNNDYKNKFFSPTLAFQGAHVPFKTNEEHYIIDHEPLAPEKKTEFNSLINNY
jgi:hypothetical protein